MLKFHSQHKLSSQDLKGQGCENSKTSELKDASYRQNSVTTQSHTGLIPAELPLSSDFREGEFVSTAILFVALQVYCNKAGGFGSI